MARAWTMTLGFPVSAMKTSLETERRVEVSFNGTIFAQTNEYYEVEKLLCIQLFENSTICLDFLSENSVWLIFWQNWTAQALKHLKAVGSQLRHPLLIPLLTSDAILAT